MRLAITALTNSRFGADTRAAVRAFQRENARKQDGVVGPLTFAALFGQNARLRRRTNPPENGEIPLNIGRRGGRRDCGRS
jgi:peptidoglycan hydrolase-like protein with peptidoglycan-binding domain